MTPTGKLIITLGAGFAVAILPPLFVQSLGLAIYGFACLGVGALMMVAAGAAGSTDKR